MTNAGERGVPGEIERRIEAGERISLEELHQWMRSPDLETQGAVVVLFDQYQNLLAGMPAMEEITGFYLRYFRRCLREDPKGEYAAGRYMAAYSLVNWYRLLNSDPAVPKSVLEELRDMLREEYVKGDEALRKCIVTGALEHLMEDPKVREDFASWKGDPVTGKAYDEALQWSLGAS
jgi:hypothetical protein